MLFLFIRKIALIALAVFTFVSAVPVVAASRSNRR